MSLPNTPISRNRQSGGAPGELIIQADDERLRVGLIIDRLVPL